ncbi:hypothetical protein ACLKA6_004255 [Drosophila palustris]
MSNSAMVAVAICCILVLLAVFIVIIIVVGQQFEEPNELIKMETLLAFRPFTGGHIKVQLAYGDKRGNVPHLIAMLSIGLVRGFGLQK